MTGHPPLEEWAERVRAELSLVDYDNPLAVIAVLIELSGLLVAVAREIDRLHLQVRYLSNTAAPPW